MVASDNMSCHLSDGYLEKIIKTYGDLNGELHLVEFERSGNGLGLSLAGNKDLSMMSVFIVGIQQDSPVAHDGRIRVGDELLEINGHVLFGRSHLNASAIIKSVNAPIIKIILLRREDWGDHMAVKPLNLPPVQHKDDPDTLLTAERLEMRSEKDVIVPEQKEVENEPKIEPKNASPADSHVNNSTSTNVTRDTRTVMLQKTSRGLGIEVRDSSSDGRPGIFVKALTPKGAAALSGQLSVGDQLVAIGNQTLEGVTLSKALELLKQSQGSIQLTIEKVVDTSASSKQANGQYNSTHPMSHDRLATDPNALCPTSHSSCDVEQQEDPATCPIIPGQEIVIQIEKGKSGLGLSIVGGADTLLGAIIIHEVYEEGAAAKDSRLWAGDQILEVNGEDLRDATHERAIQVLRETPSTVCMLVFRDESVLRDEDIYDVFTVDLMKKPGRGLGISIVGRRNDTGIFISDVVKGGVADADGRLMQGDQILSVNGEDMRDVSQEHAAAVLKTLMGKVSLAVGRLKTGSRTSLSSRHNSSNSGHSDHSARKSDFGCHGKHKGRHSKGGSQDNGWGVGVRLVDLERDSRGSLGISIAGGAAEVSGKLLVGDQILSINEESTEGLTHSEAVEQLKGHRGHHST
ncbi:Multiple PDZ domain protein [Lamellibrachia satsuma]|nr:Multiple PDZ domain protein [Lamellibrachia satsuma]